MERTATEATIKIYLREIRIRLDEAASIAKTKRRSHNRDKISCSFMVSGIGEFSRKLNVTETLAS